MTESTKQYWENRLGNNFNLKGVGYYRAGQSYNYWIYKMRKKQFLRQLKIILRHKPDPAILEIGPGTGFYTNLMLRLGIKNLSVCDITTVATKELATKYQGIKTYTNDISSKDFSLPDKNFDIILCMDVLFHITDDEGYLQALKNINRYLKDDGMVMLTENICPSHNYRGHITDRTETEILTAMKNSGFSISFSRPMFYFLNPPVNQTSKFLWRISKFRISGLYFFEKTGLGFINHLLGLLLYCTDRVLYLCRLKGFGTSLLLCKRVK